MKTLIFALLFVSSALLADDSVRGYQRSNGTYVNPYTRSSPNRTVDDNFSTRGNINPYTGTMGTRPHSYERTHEPEPSYDLDLYDY